MEKDRIDRFLEWLDREEERKGWTDYRLAKEAGLAQSVLSKARTQGIIPAWDACQAIAGALNVSPITVFRRAGLLPAGPDGAVAWDDWQYLLAQMTPEDQEEVQRIIELKIERRKKREATQKLKPKRVS